MSNKFFKKLIALFIVSLMLFGTVGSAFAYAGATDKTDASVKDLVEEASFETRLSANNGKLSTEAEYVLDVANWTTTSVGVVDDLSDYADDDLITFMVWLQELPLALKDVYNEQGLLVEGYDNAEALSASARDTINAMASGGINSTNSATSGLTINAEYFGIFAGFSVTTTKAVAHEIAALPGVHAVSEEAMFYTDPIEESIEYIPDPDYTTPGGREARQLNMIADLHAIGIDGTGVKVGMIDDGLDMTHPDLANAVTGYNFASRTTNLNVVINDHGTHTAGTVGAQGIQALGVAPGVELYNGMVFAEGSTGASQTDITAALEVFSGFTPSGNFPGLVDQNIPKVDVINMSLGNAVNSVYGNGHFERNNTVIAGVFIANSAGNEAHANTNTTNRNNYSLGSGAVMLPMSVAASQYGGQALYGYEAQVGAFDFEMVVENTDAETATVYHDNAFGITELKEDVYFGPPRTNQDPNNIWLTEEYHGNYDLHPLVYVENKGYEIHYACSSTADMTTEDMDALKAMDAYSLSGKILVVNRGQNFTDYLGEALRLGAGALIILNRDPTFIGNMVIGRVPSDEMPVFSGKHGSKQGLLDTIEADGTAYLAPGALGSVHHLKEPSSYSSIGPTNEPGFIKPDIIAPGWQILSTMPGGGYQLMSGTSMSSPFICGVAALVKQQYPDATPAEIKARIMATADPTLLHAFTGRLNNTGGYFNATGTEISVMEQGAGFANAKRAVLEDVYFIIEHEYPTGSTSQEWINGKFSSFSFGIVPRNGSATLTAEIFGLESFTVLESVYNHDTRYSNANTNFDVTVNAVNNDGKLDVTVNVGGNAVDNRQEGNIYEGYVVIQGSNEQIYYIPWATRVEGWLPGEAELIPSVDAPKAHGLRTPPTSIETFEYNGTITWEPDVPKFEFETDYTATVSLTTNHDAFHFTLDGEDTVINAPGNTGLEVIERTAHTLVYKVSYNTGENPGFASVTAVNKSGSSDLQALLFDSTCTASGILDSGESVSVLENYDIGVPPNFHEDWPDASCRFTDQASNYEIPAGEYDWGWFDWTLFGLYIMGFNRDGAPPVYLEGGKSYLVEMYSQWDVRWTLLEEHMSSFTVNRNYMHLFGGNWTATITGYFPTEFDYELYLDGELLEKNVMQGDMLTKTFTYAVPRNDTGADQQYTIKIPYWEVEETLTVGHIDPGVAQIIAVDRRGGTEVNALLFDETMTASEILEGGGTVDLFENYQQWIPNTLDETWPDGRFLTSEEGYVLAGTYDWGWGSFTASGGYIIDYNGAHKDFTPVVIEANKTYIFELYGERDVRITLAEPHLASFKVNRTEMNKLGGNWKATASGYFETAVDYEVYLGEELFVTGTFDGDSTLKTAMIAIPQNDTGVDQVYTIKVPVWEGDPNYEPQVLTVSGEDIGFAKVTFTEGGAQSDGSGYVLLFDSENKPHANSLDNYDYAIPEDHFDNPQNGVYMDSQSIMLPEGIYAVHGGNWYGGGAWNYDVKRWSDFELKKDYWYHFEKYTSGSGNWIVTEILPIEHLETFDVNRTTMNMMGGTWKATATGYFEETYTYEVYHNGALFATGEMEGGLTSIAASVTIPQNNTGVDQTYTFTVPAWEGDPNYEPKTLTVSGEDLGFARVTFSVGAPYSDGSGYVLLLDSENKPHANSLENYDYVIPEDHFDNPQNGVYMDSQSIIVPEGTYAIHGGNWWAGGAWSFDVMRWTDFVIEKGYWYHFEKYSTGSANWIVTIMPDVNLPIAKLVESCAARLPVVMDARFDGATAEFLDYSATVVNGRAVIEIPADVLVAGDYDVTVTTLDGETATATVTVLPYTADIWVATSMLVSNEDGDVNLGVKFAVAPIKVEKSVTVNGAELPFYVDGDTVVIPDAATDAPAAIVLKGVRLVDYFPSYTFTYKVNYTP